jgi:hypothetical protein
MDHLLSQLTKVERIAHRLISESAGEEVRQFEMSVSRPHVLQKRGGEVTVGFLDVGPLPRWRSTADEKMMGLG